MSTLIQRWAKKVTLPVSAVEQGCWEWSGSKWFGYGRINAGGKIGRPLLSHRVAYEAFIGPVPAGMCVLHRCDNRACCNPDHLFLGTIGDNNRDMFQKKRDHNSQKTHCPQGHPYDEQNTYWHPASGRQCRTCMTVTKRASYERAKNRALDGTALSRSEILRSFR
jgi:hypothetical protein